jgi:hypothetical protein
MCDEEKEIDQFTKDRQKKDGYRSNCKTCSRKVSSKRYHSVLSLKYHDANEEKYKVEDLKGETWKEIKEFEGLYWISNFCRVKSKVRQGGGGIKKQQVDNHGYLSVALTKNSKTYNKQIHRIFAEQFLEGYFEGAVIDHIDRNRLNNSITNLRWVTVADNNKNRTSHGSVYETSEKRKYKSNENIITKEYHYFRASYRNLKSKRFKSELEANKWLQDHKND